MTIKKTKIVCTLGPATDSVDLMQALIEKGMNVARFNFSHGTHEEQKERMDKLKAARQAANKNVGILLDTKGPEIRTHLMKDDKFELIKGNNVIISMEEVLGTAEMFSVTYPQLIDDVQVGGHILLDDGLIDLLITDIDKEKGHIHTEIQNSGMIKSRKGVNVPNVSLSLPGITEKDAADIRFGLQQGIDFIAASFVRSAKDVLEIRELLEEEGHPHVQIISKIENQEGIDNVDEILMISDGIMVARGDLGVEIPSQEVPILQKQIIRKCNEAGKPVITATQMLDSMQINPRPTRAEAGDVANAIFDGTDAVMLSGETASGAYPIQAVEMMANICLTTERALIGQDSLTLKTFDKKDMTESIGQAVGHTVKNLDIQTIVAATSSGHTAKMISKFRPKAQIIAATFDEKTSRQLTVVWGVSSFVVDHVDSTDALFNTATEVALDNGFAKEGDLIVITAGVPIGESGTTNLMKIQQIGTLISKGEGVGRLSTVGHAVVANNAAEANERMVEGGILITKQTNKDYMPAIQKSSAIITEDGGMTSHAAIVGLELNIPVVVSAKGTLANVIDGELITVDARRGRIYKGSTVAI